MRFLLYLLGDESVPIPRPGPDAIAEYGKLVEEATTAGVLLMNGGIAPTAMGSKVTRTDGEFTVTDGPFTEAKELVGGWAMIEVRDKDEAVEWAKRFQDIAGDGEMRVRQIF